MSPYGHPVPPMEDGMVQYKPIGVFHTPYNFETGAPRQALLEPETRATIEIFEPYREALKSLDSFEVILVLFHFDQIKGWRPNVRPPESDHEFGLFATRSPKRPNPIGLSQVYLEKIVDGTLHIRGVDAFEGTPVLDIKPYLPSVDCVTSEVNEKTEVELGHHDEAFIDDKSFYQ